MGTIKQPLSIGDGIPHATAVPTPTKFDGTNFPLWGPSFAGAAANQQMSWRWKADNYGASNPNVLVIIDWITVSGATAGSATWGAAFACATPGDAQSMLTDALGTEVTQATAINSTANGPNRTTITVSAANLDSMAADDSVEMRIRRTDASVTGGLVIIGLEVQYSDT